MEFLKAKLNKYFKKLFYLFVFHHSFFLSLSLPLVLCQSLPYLSILLHLVNIDINFTIKISNLIIYCNSFIFYRKGYFVTNYPPSEAMNRLIDIGYRIVTMTSTGDCIVWTLHSQPYSTF